MRRVVVTGMGAVTPLGHSVSETFDGLKEGRSGIGPITRFNAEEFSCRIAAEVKDFDISPLLSAKESRRMDIFIHYALHAAKEAFDDSALELGELDLERFGTVIGSGIGGLPMIESQHENFLKNGPRRISPFFIPSLIINLASGHVSIKYGLKGPNSAVVTACATGSHAIGDAFKLIQSDRADFMIAGGTESVVCALAVGGFASMRALSTRNDDPESASRPFDVDRDGFVLGEGCGLVILEEYEHARKRGAKIYGEVLGYGMSGDAYHITAPAEDGSGAMRVIKNALNDAGIQKERIDLINAHGTSTPAGDRIETQAIRNVFGDHTDKMMVHSSKSMLGHLLGAAGSVESIVALKTLETGIVHATANVDNLDPDCKIDPVAGDAREIPVKTVLSSSFGFGGTNSVLIFGKV